MPHTTRPSIDVDELMRRIRSEVARAGAPPPAAPSVAPSVGGAIPTAIAAVPSRSPSPQRQTRVLQQLLEICSKTASFVGGLARHVAGHGVVIAAIERELAAARRDAHDEYAQLSHSLRDEYAQLSHYLKIVEKRVQDLSNQSSHQAHDITYVKGDLTLLKLLVERANAGAVVTSDGAPAGAATAQPLPSVDAFEPFYTALQSRFRGVRDDVAQRCAVYLDRVAQLAAERARPLQALDLGCGRGEWVELLVGAGHDARGIDTNARMVIECRGRGLDATQGDALAHLRTLPDASIDVLSAFHVIEHLPFAAFFALVPELYRVLRPGGLVILETPNPDNLIVASRSFHLDPTHQRPLPAPYTAFVLEHFGFDGVTTVPLNPDRSAPQLDTSAPAVAELLNQLLYGPQDYATIATRTQR
jgi:SAM-dependent methyltransferase